MYRNNKDLILAKSSDIAKSESFCSKGIRDPTYDQESHLWYDTFETDEKIDSKSNLITNPLDIKLKMGLDESTVGLWHFDEETGIIANNEMNNNDCQ